MEITGPYLENGDRNKLSNKCRLPQDDLELCDASTVVNLSFQDNKDKPSKDNSQEIEDDISELNRAQKVASWLKLHSQCDGDKEIVEDSNEWIIQSWLNNDLSSDEVEEFLSANTRRVKVFLIDTHPNPDSDPLDFVSGYCQDACKEFSVFSKIRWEAKEEALIPLCPSCYKTGLDEELILMFMVKFRVIDFEGYHKVVVLCKDHAELFFKCSVMEYIKNRSIRENRYKLVKQHLVTENPIEEEYTPPLDLSVVLFRKVLFLVNTSLRIL